MSNRTWGAAICLALAISLKLPALIFLPYCALRRHWRLVERTLVCLVLMNLAAALLLLPSHPTLLFTSWLRVLLSSGAARAFEIGNQSFLVLMGRLLRPDGYGFNLLSLSDRLVFEITMILQLLLFCTLFFRAQRRQIPVTTTRIVDGALLSVFMVLFSPTCWVATYAALVLPLYVVLAMLINNRQLVYRSYSLVTGTLALVMLGALTNAKLWRLLGVRHIKGESYVYLVLMILPWFGLALAWTLWSARHFITMTTHERVPSSER